MCDEHRAPQVQPLCLYAVKVIGGNTSADKYLPPTKPPLYTPPPHTQTISVHSSPLYFAHAPALQKDSL